MAETSTTKVTEPDNTDAAYLKDRIQVLTHPPVAEGLPEGDVFPDDYNEFQE